MRRLESLDKQLKSSFKYTTDKGCLTLEQRQFYEDNGYLVIKRFLKDEDIKAWTDRFLDYCDKKIKP